MKYELIDINGATLIYSSFDNLKTASLGVFLKIGSRFEKQKVKGIAHFLEHILFKGSKNYTHLQIKREIEGRGGALNAFTSQEITGYYAHFLNKNLASTLDILLDMIFNPLLRRDDIDKERKVILEEIKMYNDLPSSRALILLERLIWKDHPLGQEVIGYNSTVKKIRHQELKLFKDKYYLPSNMVISFSGTFSRKKIVDLLQEKIKKVKNKASLKDLRPPAVCRGLRISCEKKNLQQVHLCLGFRGVSYLNREKLTVNLINIILGANMSSRLFENLREKKSLCYEISTEARKYCDSGAFIIHTGLDKSKIIVAISTILKELNRLKKKEVSFKELSRAKDYFLGHTAMNFERPQGRMFCLAEDYLTLGRIYDFEAVRQQIEAITPFQIKNLANSIFKFQNMCLSCVGDISKNLEERIRKII